MLYGGQVSKITLVVLFQFCSVCSFEVLLGATDFGEAPRGSRFATPG